MADYNRYQGQQGSLYGMPYITSTQISRDAVAFVSPDGRDSVTYLVVHPATVAKLRPARPSVWVRVWRWLTQPRRCRRG